MTSRPLPAHGTTARAYGSPGRRPGCHCQPCRTARNRHQKQMRVNRELGRSPFTSPAAAQAHLKLLHRYLGWDSLAAATGVPFSNLVAIYHGERKKIRHETEAKILTVTVPATGGDPGQYIDATGSTRRVRALSALGYSYTTICAAAGTCPNRVVSIAHGRQPTIRRDLAQRLAAAYRQLANTPPPSTKHTTRTRNMARTKGWDGPGAWDDDTIDDPAALPEWTGHCGSDRGWWLHRIEDIPTCTRCQAAHAQWLADHRHLPGPERFRQLALAKGAASQRGAALADDARELLAHRVDLEQAAARLGVTKQHLQQELSRHPATAQEVAA
ncbi:hypothetical protein [Streptomyces longwoodensis]|uniref:hypothetical protein n=1 Tax=Streptomyces longwoodensis TaxID=68231 RepID=UPI00381EED1E